MNKSNETTTDQLMSLLRFHFCRNGTVSISDAVIDNLNFYILNEGDIRNNNETILG